MSEPERVYINFNETQLDESVTKNIKIGSRFLKGLRLSQFDKKHTRLVFDLNESNNLKIGVWPEGSRLFIELSDEKIPKMKVVSKRRVISKRKVISKPKVFVKSKNMFFSVCFWF